MLRPAFLLAAVALTALLPSHDADACGPYVPEPEVFALSSHGLSSGATRTFVVLGEGAPEGATGWRPLAPGTFDPARIVHADASKQPMLVTMVGPSGTRTVTGKQRVYLARTFAFSDPRLALEIDAGRGADGFEVALAGVHRDAAWIGLAAPVRTTGDAAWIAAQGVVAGPGHHYVQRVGAVEVLTVLGADGQPTTLLRHGNDSYGQYAGAPIGGLEIDGQRYLLVEHAGTLQRAYLPFLTEAA